MDAAGLRGRCTPACLRRTWARVQPRLLWDRVVRLVRRPEDKFWEKQRKELGLPFLLLMLVLCVLRLIVNTLPSFGNGFDGVGVFFESLYVLLFAGVTIGVLYTNRLPGPMCEGLGLALLVLLALHDLANCSRLSSWLWMILVTDVLILIGAGRPCRVGTFLFTLAYIALVTAEDAQRFGLWDFVNRVVPGKPKYEPLDAQGWSWGVNVFLVRIGVYGVNFLIVHYVAQQVLGAMRVAEVVANALVRGDLDSASMVLEEKYGADVDYSGYNELRRAFTNLLSNLRWYRSYIPDSVFTVGQHDGDKLVRQNLAVIQVQMVYRPRTSRREPSPRDTSGDEMEALREPLLSHTSGGALSEAPCWEEAEQTGRDFIDAVFTVAKRHKTAVIHTFDARSALVIFGAGQQTEEADGNRVVEEAALCALDLGDELEVRGEAWERDYGQARCGVRMAVVYSEVLAGMLGSSGRRAYHVMGRAVELARNVVAAGNQPAIFCNAGVHKAMSAHSSLRAVSSSGSDDGSPYIDLDCEEDSVMYRVVPDREDDERKLRRELNRLVLPEERELAVSSLSKKPFWELVGTGSCGKVYRAERGAGRDECAVKELRVDDGGAFGGTLRRRVQFLRELHVLNSYRSKYIVNFYGWAKGTCGELYLVMEYCSRGSLKESAYRTDLTPEQRGGIALAMAQSVAQALTTIHEAGDVHLDVATRNVLINERGEYKLGDVGLLTKQGSPAPIISIPWSPPEAVRVRSRERVATEAHDVWSFGMLVYEVLVGGPPFKELRSAAPSAAQRIKRSASKLTSPRSTPQRMSLASLPEIAAVIPVSPPPPIAHMQGWRDAVRAELAAGNTPLRPMSAEFCPICAMLWNTVVRPCWAEDPSDRPPMAELVGRLRRLSDQFSDHTRSGSTLLPYSAASTGSTRRPTISEASRVLLRQSSASVPADSIPPPPESAGGAPEQSAAVPFATGDSFVYHSSHLYGPGAADEP